MLLTLKRRVGTRIVLSYLVALSLVIGIGILAIVQLNRISAIVNDLTNNLAVDRGFSKDIVNQALLARFYANKYVRTQSQTDEDHFNDEFAKLEGLLIQADRQITNPERVEMLNRIKPAVKEYGDTFQEVAELVRKRQRIHSEVLDVQRLVTLSKLAALRVHALSLDDPAVFLAFANAQNAFQLMRVYASKYLEAGNERYAIEFQVAYQQAQAALSSLETDLQDPAQRENVAHAKAADDAYHKGFQTIHADYVKLKDLFKTKLDVLEPEISDTASEIAASIEQEFERQNEFSQALIFQARLVLVLTTTIPILTGLGLGMVIIRRITERELAEEELRKHRDHLEDLVAERTVDLEGSLRQLEQEMTERNRAEGALQRAHRELGVRAAELEEANAELSQYAYVVSHDLKTPLRAVHNYADFIREDLEATLDGDQKMYLDGLGRAVQEAEVLVEDLLELSRIGRLSVPIETVDVGAFLRELMAILGPPADVEIVMADDWPTIVVEPVLLGQIFQNLIGNAVKFNDAPHKRVELGWQPASPPAGGTEGGPQAYEFFVRDNGIGIEPRYHEQIFRAFERLHTKEEYEGTGIGLAIVKKAASKLGGSVRVESKPGQGSTFFVTLPNVKRET